MDQYLLLLIFLFQICLVYSQTETEQGDEIKLCPCDVTGSSCDVKCCCDEDCSEGQKRVFGGCGREGEGARDPRVCLSPTLLLRNNTSFRNSLRSDGLLCIYYDNFEERNFYLEPDRVEEEEEFLAELEEEGREGEFGTQFNGPPLYRFFVNYNVGDPVWVIQSGSLKKLSLPQPIFSQACPSEPASIGLLENLDSECHQNLPDISERSCTENPQLSAHLYAEGMEVVKSPTILNELSVRLEDDSLENIVSSLEGRHKTPLSVEILDEGTGTSAREVVDLESLKPTYSAETQTCENVVKKVEYLLSVNATRGISKASVAITIGPTSLRRFPQIFSAKFTWDGEEEPELRLSGNPGYVRGKPVMAGQRVEMDGKVAVGVESHPDQWLTIVASRFCSDGSKERRSVVFGNEMQSGCLIEISAETGVTECRSMQTRTLEALEGPARDLVASFANASLLNPADWVPILRRNRPTSNGAGSNQVGSCSNLLVGLDIHFLFALTGNALDPQAKIVGAMFTYRSRDVHFQCVGAACVEGGLEQRVGVVTTVSWTEVSSPASPALARIPSFDLRLPHDFFYPFTGAAPSTFSSSYSSLFILLSILLFTSYYST